MSLYKYLLILLIFTVIAWFGWLLVLMFINPFQSGWIGFLFFYASLAIALLGTFSLIGFLFRSFIKKDVLAHKHISIASRQSFLFTGLVIVTLILQSLRFLMWWNLLLLIIFTGFIELFFVSYKKTIK